MRTIYDQMRNDVRKVHAVARQDSTLQGVPSDTLSLIFDNAIEFIDEMEAEAKKANSGCDCCGCGQCG
jgi:hypothetical protein